MATFKYVLVKNTVKMRYSFARGVKITKSVKVSLNNPKNWIIKSQKIKECREEPGAKQNNFQLNDIRTQFEKEVAEIQRDNAVITNDTLIDIADYVIGNKQRKAAKIKIEFMDLLYNYGHTKGILSPISGEILKPGTQESYRSTYKCLQNYEKENSKKITFESINLSFFNDFRDWCSTRDYKEGTFGKFIKNIKALMNAGLELGHHSNHSHRKKGFKVYISKDEDIFLDEKELDQLFNLKLKKDSLDDIVRDWFIIGANTGFRAGEYAQLSSLNIESIDNQKVITKTTEKTGVKVALPVIKPQLLMTLKKRNFEFPKKVHKDTINIVIKELAKLAGITKPVEITDTRLSGKQIIVKPKYELVKNHTSRRSFCTNAYLNNMEAHKIMIFSGHKKLDTFMRYIKADHLQKAKLFESEPFFQK
ncbi:site-specific integrase [Bacteroidia bacterium]|nr:site-specific integrase [Bacteroidia bacterium]